MDHRCAVLSAESRAGQRKYFAERAAADWRGRIEEKRQKVGLRLRLIERSATVWLFVVRCRNRDGLALTYHELRL